MGRNGGRLQDVVFIHKECGQMKRTTKINSAGSRQYRKHPIGWRLVVGLLCICLLLVSLPIEHFGYLAEAAQGQEIISFSELPQEVSSQTVEVGTQREELNLPKELKATCRSLPELPVLEGSAMGNADSSAQMISGTVEGAGLSQEKAGTEGGDKGLEVPNPSSPGEGAQEQMPSQERMQGQIPPEEGTQEQIPSEEGTEPGIPEKEPESAGGSAGAESLSPPEEGTNPGTSEEDLQSPEEQPQEEKPESPEGQPDGGRTEICTIEDITWVCEPQYDGETAGSYVFTPVLPISCRLAAGIELPEITVSVVGEGKEQKQDKAGRKTRKIQAEESILFGEEGIAPQTEPGCGIISEDTVWETNVTLANGELIVEPGVTLTIKGVVTVQGNVTIKGGGIIVRGSANACFKAQGGVHLIVGEITLDGASLPSSGSLIQAIESEVILDDGCTIQNCTIKSSNPSVQSVDSQGNKKNFSGSGAAIYLAKGKAVFNDIVLENNRSLISYGGAVFAFESELRVYGGLYRNNRTEDLGYGWGGGCLYNSWSKFYIYGGKFIGNTSTGKGGCIVALNDKRTETYLYGGYFEGNVSSFSGYQGSGAIYHCAYDPLCPDVSESVLDLSGNVQFSGNGTQGSGVDGVYLEFSPINGSARKVQISDTLRYPVTLYLKASEGYVIAEGTNSYRLLHERDMKKINFVDVGGSGKTWYAVLDKEKNQVYLSQNKPNYGYYVYYISNGAAGTVVDDANDGAGYQIGDLATVQPADGLEREGYAFREWNTEADGSGKGYRPGEKLDIQGDTDLYAIFEKGKVLSADFYSGSAGQKETKSVGLGADEGSGTVTAPQLAEMDGWRPAGWSADKSGFRGEVAPGEEVTLTGDRAFYGVYEKDVVLSYEAEGADTAPEDETGKAHANVHDEVSTSPAQFTAAPAAVRYGYAFAGWNTEKDGTGRMYKEGDDLEAEADMTLYAVFKKPLHAFFYSGSAGEKEEQVVEIPEDATSGTTRAPELKAFRAQGGDAGQEALAAEGFCPVGWDLQEDGYNGTIQAGEEVTLTDDTSYYGVYRKEITLRYEAGEAEGFPKEESAECRANVHDSVTCEKPWFGLLPAPAREGYVFQGWNTEEDGSGITYAAASRQQFAEDTVLYASWKDESGAPYRVEHYLQKLEGDGYLLDESGTEELFAKAGETVQAHAREYAGFTENKKHGKRSAAGEVKADGSLTLRLFYDRDVYHVEFDLNGGGGDAPGPQDVRYGGLLQTVDAPERAGYHFKGWYLDSRGSRGKQWDFARTVEQNASSGRVTLYAKWADEIAPVLGKASYGKGHKDILGWILHKDRLEITTPITEEGSGVRQVEYVLTPQKAVEGKGKAAAEEEKAAWIQPAGSTQVYGAIGLPLGAANAGGKIDTVRKGRARVTQKGGGTAVEFTIAEDFKGTVNMTAVDWAGNISAEKILTSKGGGIIVEDNAPDIRMAQDEKARYDNACEVHVEIRDNAGGNISGGIAGVSCQIDGGEEKTLPGQRFSGGIVETYKFTMKISGAGSHSLRVNARDNAGNRSSREISVDIPGAAAAPPPGAEPKTGDGSHVEIYATISMIAGFTYLLLYFREHGMTEERKEELVSKLVNWAKGKGGIQRMAAIALIFLPLAYYHSIGKTVDAEWKENAYSEW